MHSSHVFGCAEPLDQLIAENEHDGKVAFIPGTSSHRLSDPGANPISRDEKSFESLCKESLLEAGAGREVTYQQRAAVIAGEIHTIITICQDQYGRTRMFTEGFHM